MISDLSIELVELIVSYCLPPPAEINDRSFDREWNWGGSDTVSRYVKLRFCRRFLDLWLVGGPFRHAMEHRFGRQLGLELCQFGLHAEWAFGAGGHKCSDALFWSDYVWQLRTNAEVRELVMSKSKRPVYANEFFRGLDQSLLLGPNDLLYNRRRRCALLMLCREPWLWADVSTYTTLREIVEDYNMWESCYEMHRAVQSQDQDALLQQLMACTLDKLLPHKFHGVVDRDLEPGPRLDHLVPHHAGPAPELEPVDATILMCSRPLYNAVVKSQQFGLRTGGYVSMAFKLDAILNELKKAWLESYLGPSSSPLADTELFDRLFTEDLKPRGLQKPLVYVSPLAMIYVFVYTAKKALGLPYQIRVARQTEVRKTQNKSHQPGAWLVVKTSDPKQEGHEVVVEMPHGSVDWYATDDCNDWTFSSLVHNLVQLWVEYEGRPPYLRSCDYENPFVHLGLATIALSSQIDPELKHQAQGLMQRWVSPYGFVKDFLQQLFGI